MNIYWIWLSTIKYVGPILQKALLKYFGDPKAIFDASKEELGEVHALNRRALDSITENKSLMRAEKIMEDTRNKNIKLLRYGDPLYPAHAMVCPESPVLLYYKGDLKPILNGVAVVGSRRCTPYGKRVAQEIGMELAGMKVPLLSGFAKGIDSYAQAACLEHGGYTMGFLANGVDICYPKEQRALYDRLMEAGSVFISQYPPGSPPKPPYFLERNQVMSAWSKEVVVVEATAKSGALWTAEFAYKYGRRVFAVPHEIGIAEGVGVNRLLAKGVAEPFLGIGSLGLAKSEKIADPSPREDSASEDRKEILTMLRKSPLTISEIANHFSRNEEDLLEELLILELAGKVMIRGNTVSIR